VSDENAIRAGVNIPHITDLRIMPVAGYDSMLLNLSGAHAPYFTRNLAILTDNAGHVGVGEVPGGEKIRKALHEVRELLIGYSIGSEALVVKHVVSGKSSHDARLVAAMQVHGLSAILTFDKTGCARFPGIQVVYPTEIEVPAIVEERCNVERSGRRDSIV